MSSRLQLLIRPLANVYCNNLHGRKKFHRWVAPTLQELYRRKERMGPQPPSRRSDYIEWNYRAELYSFGKRLGEDFNEDLLRKAFTEESFVATEKEKQKKVGIELSLALEDNIELAASGERFIDTYTERYLRTTLPRLPLEHIRAIKEDLLQTENLSHISFNLGINDLVMCADNPPKQETLSRTFKAVVQVLILSSGEDRAAAFVRDFVLTQLSGKDITPLCTPKKPLNALQTALGSPTESRLIAESGKNSILPNYQVGIYLDKKLVGRGCGESPIIAEEMAALDGLWKIWGVTANKRPFPFQLQLPPVIESATSH